MELVERLIPMAIGIGMNPLVFIGAIVIASSGRVRAIGPAYLGGWITSVTMFALLGTSFYSVLLSFDADGAIIIGVVQMVLGAYLLRLCWKNWANRPKRGEQAELPKWIEKLDGMRPRGAWKLSFSLCSLNLKVVSVVMAVAAILVVNAESAIVVTIGLIVFILFSALPMAIPFIIVYLSRNKSHRRLGAFKDFLLRYEWVIVTTVLLIAGISTLVSGINVLITGDPGFLLEA